MAAVALSNTEASGTVSEGNAEENDTGKVGMFKPSRLGKLAAMLGMAICATLAVGVLSLTIGPRFLPYQTYTVLSGSMEPNLPIGAVIFAVPSRADDLNAGDIITIEHPERPGMLVTHRIVAIESGPQGRSFKTKGDANQVPDSWRVPGTGSGFRFAFAIPYVGYILSALQSGPGRVVLLILPTLLLGGLLLAEIWRPSKSPNGALATGA